MFGLSEAFWGPVVVALIGLIGIALPLLQVRSNRKLRQENDEQHMRGYTLLQSIDQRTIAIDEKVDNHGEWIARHEQVHANSDR